MYLSKSLYCECVQCNKMLWLNKHYPEEKQEVANSSVLDNGTEVGILAKNLFGPSIDIDFNQDLNKMIEDTKKELTKEKVIITEASFNYNNNFCSVDILKKDNNSYELYEVKSSTEVKDIYLHDASYQYYVLTKLGLNVTKVSIVYINSEYVREEELELDKLFIIKDITDIAISKLKEVENKIKEINKYMEQKIIPKDDIGMHCVKPYDCPFFKYCTKHLPEQNIFNIRGMPNRSKFKLYHEGIYDYNNLLKTKINNKYKEQIEYELYDKEPKINIDKIKEFISTLSYPLYFLDFETYQQSIPEYIGIKPYEQIPFQYSLHYIEKENGKLLHKEFLSAPNIDPRRSLAESLVNDIPENVCTIAYNMMFEKMVIKNLAKIYPDLSNHLMNIYNNMKDLMIPFKDREYYTKEMYGSYSIKYVLPALFPNDPSLDYHNLEGVHNGSEAMNTFSNLGNLSIEEQQIVRNNLLRYCELDTYAMVKIWDKLENIVKERSETNGNRYRKLKK
ncbi:MAG: DUF2779 domain-containing protein [Bacilli bacterium]|nr:DUF2779 domain-containing protein [Bacilli bacterium]